MTQYQRGILAALTLITMLSVLSSWLLANDRSNLNCTNWPQWRGPNRDGKSTETGLIKSFPEDGPSVLWRRTIGTGGYSGIAVVGDFIYTMYSEGDYEYALCLDMETGLEIWRFLTDKIFLNPSGYGPRSTPTVDRDRVYVLSAKGRLYCLKSTEEKEYWRVNLLDHYGGKTPRWGFCASPIVVGDLLLVEIDGSTRNRITAFNKFDGSVVWESHTDRGFYVDNHSSSELDKMGYSSPVVLAGEPEQQVLFFTGTRLLSISETGDQFWQYSWPTRYGANVATPVVLPGGRVFISSGYNQGGAVVEPKKVGNQYEVTEVWRNRAMSAGFPSPIYHEGYLYGFDDSVLKCISAETGKTQWRKSRLGLGSIIFADGQLVVLTEKGELVLVEASPDDYKQNAKAQVFGRIARKCWTPPSLANGRLYARTQLEMVSIDFRK